MEYLDKIEKVINSKRFSAYLFIGCLSLAIILHWYLPPADNIEYKNYEVLTIDGCEYIKTWEVPVISKDHYQLVHKGNCSNSVHVNK